MGKPSRIITYTKEERLALALRFLEKFNQDPRKFKDKLVSIHMSKGTYSYLLNGKTLPYRETIEIIKAYLENRAPRNVNPPEGYVFCTSCETVVPLTRYYPKSWSCYECKNERERKSDERCGNHKRFYQQRLRRRIKDPEFNERVLRMRRRLYIRNNYGPDFVDLVEIMNDLKKLGVKNTLKLKGTKYGKPNNA